MTASRGAEEEEARRLRTTALQNIQSILRVRQNADQELRRTKEALEEETRILELLNKTGTTLASSLDLQSLVQAVTDAGRAMSGAQFGAFFYTVTDPAGGSMTLYTLSGAPREAFEKFGHPRATPIFAPTFRAEGVVRSGDITKDPRYGKLAPHHGMPANHLPVRSYLAVPVVSRGGAALGGLFFGHPDPDVFSERSERLVIGIAAQAAIAIDNARLFEDAKRAADDRARLLEAERAARTEIERVSLMKDEFLATLSHELRTPLNAILGWSKLLLMRIPPGTDTKGLDAIARNASAQAQLIEDLLDMNRIVSGKIRLDVHPIELAPLVAAAIDSVRPSADAKGIRIRSSLDASSGLVPADPNRIQQVVWNLLTNAVKFTPRGGDISILVRRHDAFLEVEVGDSGMGIDPEFLPYLFERFRQADSSTTRKFGGLGLGLSIVKQLVELHGGTVEAESDGEGKGATFRVRLPYVPLHEVAANPRARDSGRRDVIQSAAPLSLAGYSVLVVDDVPDALEVVMSVLTEAGARVLTASSAAEGITILTTARPDIIVSDIGMPGRDGHDFIRDVRRMEAPRGRRTPAIALTAFARSEDRTSAIVAGYQAHIAKPIDPRELVAIIKSLLVEG